MASVDLPLSVLAMNQVSFFAEVLDSVFIELEGNLENFLQLIWCYEHGLRLGDIEDIPDTGCVILGHKELGLGTNVYELGIIQLSSATVGMPIDVLPM